MMPSRLAVQYMTRAALLAPTYDEKLVGSNDTNLI